VNRTQKRIMTWLAPRYMLARSARRWRELSERLEREWGCSDLTNRFVREYGAAVRHGPFAGLRYVQETHHRHLACKLLGAYECELHAVWREVLQRDYSQIIDIGCAEGYYAVGLARRCPRAEVVAFDTDAWARRVVELMARSNGVTNLTINNVCTPQWLQVHLRSGAFVLCDCEGAEDQLLDPAEVPLLFTCDLLVELHEARARGVTARFLQRFGESHDLAVIRARTTDPMDYAELQGLGEAERRLAVSDLRGEQDQQWLYASSKSGSSPA
jgi:hypothetical protein